MTERASSKRLDSSRTGSTPRPQLTRRLSFDTLEDRSLLSGTITGTVFQDYNANGTRDTTALLQNAGDATDPNNRVGLAVDRGIGGVTIQAYDASGILRGTANSDSVGAYSLTATGTGPYRIQFTLPGGFTPAPQGTSNGGAVQFVPDGNSSNVNLGLVVPRDYLQDNPDLVTNCYVLGDQVNGPNRDSLVLISFPYSAGSNNTGTAPGAQPPYQQPTTHTLGVRAREVGTTWGLGYNTSSRTLYAAAFMKKHAGFGPSGTGAIYAINRDSGAVSTYVDLNSPTLFGTGTTGADPHNPLDYLTDNYDATFDAVGKISLGGLDVSADGSTIYAMNLADRQLYAIPTSGTLNTTTIRRVSIPLNAPGATGTNGADLRPFAVTVFRGVIYVGIVNSAQSTGLASDLKAYVYTVDPTTLTFSASPVFQMDLNYPRGRVHPRTDGTNFLSALWNPWSATFPASQISFAPREAGYPQPMLTGIAFDDSGNMVLGLRDRFGDQTGPSVPADINNTIKFGISAGDTLRAFINTPGNLSSGWTLENNGRGPSGQGTGPQNNGQGPGGTIVGTIAQGGMNVTGSGEFYFQDDLPNRNGGTPEGNDHDEVSIGGILQLPGRPDVLTSAFDPAHPVEVSYNTGGIQWYNNTTGAFTKGYILYDSNVQTGPFAKAAGIGDITVFADLAPIQIGDRVWNDDNNNGIQDANENGLSNVSVSLVYAGTNGTFGDGDDQTFTTTTNSTGVYLFDSTNVTGSIVSGGNYQVRIDKTQTALANYVLSPANQGSDDGIDSDGTMSGNNAVISVTPTATDHSLDFGFNNPNPLSLGNQVWNDVNNNGTLDSGETGINNVTVRLYASGGIVALETTTTSGNGNYLFQNLAAGSYFVEIVLPSGFVSSTGLVGSLTGPNEPAVDPDNNTDDVDDGTTGTGNVVRTQDITLVVNGEPGGNSNLTVDFGVFQPVQVCGTVFVDANGNGTREAGENPLSGVTIALTTSGGTTLATLMTMADGSYCFPNVVPGNFQLVQTQPTGYGSSTPNTIPIVVPSGGLTNQNFGETLGTLSGVVYRDDNNNGTQNAGEPGLPGVAVTLMGTDVNNQVVMLMGMTDSTGAYSFTGLLQGTYKITETQPTNYNDGSDSAGPLGGTVTNDMVANIVLPPGGTGTGNNFGELGTFLSGFVYIDADRNMTRGGTEVGIDVVTLTLFDSLGNQVTTAVTSSTGAYRFDNLAAGTYTVTETQPTGFGSSTPDTLSNLTVPLAGLPNQNFGDTTASISGLVFRDDNNNGTKESAEPGIGGVPVTLMGTDANNNPISQMLNTMSDGTFLFTGLLSGTYILTETQPTAYNDGQDRAGTAGGTVANDIISAIPITPGSISTGYTFGELGTFLSGTVFVDTNRNGIFEGGEAGLRSVTLTLFDSNNNQVGSTTTALDGTYRFDNLAAGTYRVDETQPTGFGSSTPNTINAVVPLAGLPNQNFGETGSSIAGRVYRDDNNNGIQDGSEPAISGVTISLSGTDANGQPVTTSTQTAADGSYLFDGLLQGTYTVTETQPSAYNDGIDAVGTSGGTLGNDTISAIPLGAVQATGYNFGERGTTLSGRVFLDFNRNGILDPGDTGLSNVTITLTGGPTPVSMMTGPDGSYTFSNLPTGNYTVTETQPTAYGSSTPDVLNVTLPLAGLTNQNFGETTGSIAGTVYRDDNNNGTRDSGEPAISGVLLTLTGMDANGQSISRTTTTGADGSYLFSGLAQGTYTVTETQPTNYNDGLDRAGSAGGTVGNDVLSAISLGAAVDATGYDFGERGSPLSGLVFVDSNLNGIRDSGEPGIGGVTLVLRDASGIVVGSTMTANDGTYSFANLATGNYTINETQPAGYASTTPNTLSVTLPVAGLTDQNFGESAGSLAGKVYRDDNNNGVQDTGEPGIGGVSISLTGMDINGQPVALTTMTGFDGAYSFTGLLQGTYTLSETQPTNYNDGSDSLGTAGGTLGNDNVSNIPLGAGFAGTAYNFGELGAGLSGVVFVDTNTNGVLDAGETGLPGVVITVRDTNNNVIASTTTGPGGAYAIMTLVPGDYIVTETQPPAYGSSSPNTLNVTVPLTGLTDQNFGETTGSLSGQVYVDTNDNGTPDGGETGIGTVTITLTGTDINGQPISRSTTTAADGTYSFTGLLAGTYTLTETQPTTFTDGKDTAGNLGGTVGSDSVSTIVLGGGVAGTGYNFGERTPTTTISGVVFVDANGNGIRDAGETGIPNVLITLRDAANNPAGTATTGADGSYTLSNVLPGNYSILETQPPGYGSSTPNTLTVTVPTNGLTNQNFGETTGSLSGRVYVDTNDNGTPDGGETGIGTVTITLTGTDINGQPISRSTTTAADGTYSFTGLLAGTYTLTETQPTTFTDGIDTAGNLGGTVANDSISAIGVAAAGTGTGYNFGERSPLASLSGVVYVDANRNGTRETGETGLGGVTLTLRDSQNAVVATMTTQADGSYSFPNLPTGTYSLVQTQPPGYGSSTPDTLNVTVPTGGLTNQNFGETTGSIAGTVFRDDNNTGIQDAGEPGLGGVSVTLTGTDVNGQTVNRSTTTAANGTYSFTGLLAGTYTLTETVPTGLSDGKDAAGTAGGTITQGSTDTVSGVALTAGTNATGYNFGELGATLSGRAFRDDNNNGVQDPGEVGIPNVLITLTGTDVNGQPVTRTTTTDANGNYTFVGLVAGTYTLTETQPGGFNDGKDTAGSGGGNAGNDVITGIILAAGESVVGNTFGEVLATTGTPIFSKSQLLATSTGNRTANTQEITNFVTRLYPDVLGRTGSAGEINYWVSQLQNGASTKSVAQAFWTSAEHRGQQVDAFYIDLLGRPADPNGRAAWVNALLRGASETDLILGIINSQEFSARNPDARSYLSALYTQLLGRPLDDGGAAYWLPLLQNAANRPAVALAIVNSTECYQKVISQYYLTFLGRAVDASGLQYWTEQLRRGLSFGELAWCLLGTSEYFVRR